MPVDQIILGHLDRSRIILEEALESDVVLINAPMMSPLQYMAEAAMRTSDARRERVTVVLHTSGGSIEIVERIVNSLRNSYQELWVLVPDHAMSAGTVFAMAGNDILMDSFSILGPIDPQVPRKDKNGQVRLVPALAYLEKYEEFIRRSAAGDLTTLEYTLAQNLDLAELVEFREAKLLSVDLLKKWLVTHKFRDWKSTEARNVTVTDAMKTTRANEIAEALSRHDRWHSHGRGINMETVINELNLRITDFRSIPAVGEAVDAYFATAHEYCGKLSASFFVHAQGFHDVA